MAVTLGFILVFAAGIAGAYFAGVQAAKSRVPVVPAPSRRTNTGNAEASADPEPLAADALAAASNAEAVAADPPASAAEESSGVENATEQWGSFSDTRRFERLPFSGMALATIYPPQSQPDREPIRCEVLTRDLSCGGIGIGHTDRLLPHQMVVVDAVGKLLVGEVRWCQRVDKDLYVAGCRLIKTTT